ncbi:class I SAM-dependent methyltransferase [Paenibacillus paeoniae]|uniref:Class I SAM-dependent methyltransferase n=1 Tax=Paenibacillus paeoniae TaxID=2292705 RepID=A0A371PFN4_9BACL|nr:class I SAM-dependent methyltransferase [Paenibacillus paeoniae]REK74416.1 class I SAM-dependent methyltransferase [Paenibacillus paeoniae]
MGDRSERLMDKQPYEGVGEIFREFDLLAGMAYLFASESGIRLSGAEGNRNSAQDRLMEQGWVSPTGRLIDTQLAYSCYEYYRQMYRQEPLDLLLIEEASGRRRIVDICCGGGATIFALLKAERRERVCGIDAASEPIELLQTLLETEGCDVRGSTSAAGTAVYRMNDAAGGQQIDTHIGDIHQLPWREASFDMAICRASLHYLNVKRAIGEMHRVLEPGGRLFLLVHGSGYPLDYLIHRRGIWSRKTIVYALRKWRAAWGGGHAPVHSKGRYLSRKQVENLLTDNGFGHIRYYTDKNRMIGGRFPVYFAIAAEKMG